MEWDKLAGLLLVVALHAAALWGLWQHRLIPSPQEAMTVFVNFIAPPTPKELPMPPPPKPRPVERSQPQQLVAEAPAAPVAEVAVPPAPTPAISAPVESRPSAPAGPVTLDAELSVSCPERTAPTYPLLSRRVGETGIAVLRVELDERGQVATARVATGSGFARLDEAALSAVISWRCNPAQRNGQPVRAGALHPF